MIRHLIVTMIMIISAIFFLSCRKQSIDENSKIITEKKILKRPFKNDSLEFLDSTIV